MKFYKRFNVKMIAGEYCGCENDDCDFLADQPGVQTPNLDNLASQGMRFLDFHVANPVCSPSRTAFMTGQFPSTLGIFNFLRSNHDANHGDGMPDYLNASVPTITRILQESGYRTGHFGKWHLGKHCT